MLQKYSSASPLTAAARLAGKRGSRVTRWKSCCEIAVGQRCADSDPDVRAVVDGAVREERPLHQVDEVGADVVQPLALLGVSKNHGGRMFGAPDTIFIR